MIPKQHGVGMFVGKGKSWNGLCSLEDLRLFLASLGTSSAVHRDCFFFFCNQDSFLRLRGCLAAAANFRVALLELAQQWHLRSGLGRLLPNTSVVLSFFDSMDDAQRPTSAWHCWSWPSSGTYACGSEPGVVLCPRAAVSHVCCLEDCTLRARHARAAGLVLAAGASSLLFRL